MSEGQDRKETEAPSAGPSAPGALGGGEPPVETSDSDIKRAEEDEIDEALLDEVDLREIMRQALDKPPEGGAPELLRGVQRKLRTRSRGKFYSDGWSTSSSPRSTYLTTSLIMLVLIAFVFLVLIPWSSGALPNP